MENLNINETKDAPCIDFNADTGILLLSGQSLCEDASLFYEPARKWLEQYRSAPKELTTLIFQLQYFNSSSSKQLLKILYEMEKLEEAGKAIKVIWRFPKGNTLLEERGAELEMLVDIVFEYEAQ